MGNEKRGFVVKLKSYFREYLKKSSIHGLQYMGENRTLFELSWWVIIFLICLATCTYFIAMVYNKWETSPVIVSFATKETPIHEIPFPAVTICPETKAIKKHYSHSDMVKKLTYQMNMTETEYIQTSYMSMICDINMTEQLSQVNLTEFHVHDENFFKFIYNIMPNVINYFSECMWMNKKYPCDELFEPILTDEGVCATFNMLDKSAIYKDDIYIPPIPFGNKAQAPKNVTWQRDKGYSTNDKLQTYPRRALFSGAKNALSLYIMTENENLDHACKMSLQGFKVTLHTPSTMPRPSQGHFRLPLNAVVISAVQPNMITTADTVKVFKPEKRECYFLDEKPLRFFKEYTQRNCQLECLTNFTLDWCWCVNFFMPRDNITSLCGSLEIGCMEQAEEILQTSNINEKLGNKKKYYDEGEVVEIPKCQCLPVCTDLSYQVESSSSTWDWRNIEERVYMNESFHVNDSISLSRLIIYFKNSQFVTSERHELYGPTDFLGNFGGLLGLFTGFSLLSLMEILYFLTIRIVGNLFLSGNWSGEKM